MRRKFFYLAPALLLVGVVLMGASCEVSTTDTDTEVTANTNEAMSTAWTEDIDQGSIPSVEATGTLNGEDFTVAHAQVTNWDDYYTWYFTDTAPDSSCGVIVDDNAIGLSTKDLQVGTLDLDSTTADYDDYSAYYYYEQEDGIPMSVNTDWTGQVVVTDYDQEAGTISGYMDFEFSDGLTVVSGAFSGEVCQ